MYFSQGLNLPVILFAARPTDSRKGLQTFLDAISCLYGFEDLPEFCVWIVGGSHNDIRYISGMLQCRPSLAKGLLSGKTVVWGRVAHEAMPEIYSRSLVAVMPSSREQFGLVAAEAMMCGLPVIANSTGGLKDVVLDGLTGNLLEANDSCLLANVIAGYLRNPKRRDFYGRNAREWAEFAFCQSSSHSSIESLYCPDREVDKFSFRSYSEHLQQRIATLGDKCATMLGEQMLNCKDLSSGAHISFQLSTKNRRYFVKAYALEPSMNACVFRVTGDLRMVRTFEEYAGKCRFHTGNNAAPQPLAYLPDESAIIFEWCEPLEFATVEDERRAIANVASEYRQYSTPEDTPELSNYVESLSALFANPSLDTLLSFDLAGAQLNLTVCGGVKRFAQTHPQAELLRYRLRLGGRNWALPDSFLIRTEALLEYLLLLDTGVVAPPLMCNGSLKGEHLLKGLHGLVACDIDSCRYAVGPLDEAHYVFKRVLRQGIGPAAAMSELQSMLTNRVEVYLGLCWIVVYLIYEALARLTEGKYYAANVLMKFSQDFFQVCHESFGEHESV